MESSLEGNLKRIHDNHAWQPFTQMKLAHTPYKIDRGAGVYLYEGDRPIIDAVGSWWVNLYGHCNPRINEAVIRQLETMEHAMYAGMTHEPALRLSEALSAQSGDALPRVFFSDNGSTAVEIGLKMAFQFFQNHGRSEKRHFISLKDGYHGDTIGTMSVGTRSVFHKMYEPLLFDVFHVASPSDDFDFAAGKVKAQACDAALEDLERLLREKGDTICGFILEPLIQGAGGMKFYSPEYLKKAKELCKKHDVFLIADEVFVGAGRLGSYFAFGQSGVWPDIIALSKGLSGGYFPFAATLASEEVYRGFYSDDRMHTLFHGHSMTGNPPGCVASLVSLEIFEELHQNGVVQELEQWHRRLLINLMEGPAGKHVRNCRYFGSVAALDVNLDSGYTGDFAPKMLAKSIEKGALIRPLANTVYLTPPLIIEEEQLDTVYEVLESSLEEIVGG
ncbi:MAG: adenosylmethionine--8-amino-7-oxononanoate transaminase [Leptospiraceae bacterium]|nr:adenosylmethionine--8-amino-7-oxononanoate transaminase [Leptospiraceae bacterium]